MQQWQQANTRTHTAVHTHIHIHPHTLSAMQYRAPFVLQFCQKLLPMCRTSALKGGMGKGTGKEEAARRAARLAAICALGALHWSVKLNERPRTTNSVSGISSFGVGIRIRLRIRFRPAHTYTRVQIQIHSP